MTLLLHPDVGYWDKGEGNVPDMTGASRLLDAHDLRTVFAACAIEVPIHGSVLDVGCGTGRLAQLCAGPYWGVDITPSAVAYCQARGIPATLINGPSFPLTHVDLVTCISVFTHISRAERQAYLDACRAVSDRLVVDIIPGPESGETRLWTADPDVFVADLHDAGYVVEAVTDQWWDDQRHRYFAARGR